jgi:hypothetical protein
MCNEGRLEDSLLLFTLSLEAEGGDAGSAAGMGH